MKRRLSILLTLCLIFSALFVFNFPHPYDCALDDGHGLFSYGAAAGTKTMVKYHLDLGFQQGWLLRDGAGALRWNTHGGVEVRPGNTINVTTTIDVSGSIPDGASLIEAKAKTIESSGFMFLYGGPVYSFNPTPYLGGQKTWDDNYHDYVANVIPIEIATVNGNNVTFSYAATLKSNINYSIKDSIENMAAFMQAFGFLERPSHYDEIKGTFWDFPLFLLLGGEDEFSHYRPDLYGNFMNAALSVYDKLTGDADISMMDGGAEAWMWFTPVVLELFIETPAPKCIYCEECPLEDVPDIDYCGPDTCPKYDTPPCGCYKLCNACKYCTIDKSVSDVCTPSSCTSYGMEDCGCFYNLDIHDVIPPPDTSGCSSSSIQWSETQAHTYRHSPGCLPGRLRPDGTRGPRRCPGHTCNHVYTYQTALTSTSALTAANPNGNALTNPLTGSVAAFKSGYGFSVALNNSISTSQVSNSGACGQATRTKEWDATPQPPLLGIVQNSWAVANTDTRPGNMQPMTVYLQRSALSANDSAFICAQNNISNNNNRLIYTNVALAGTKAYPRAHTIQVQASGGGVPGVAEWCMTHSLSFIINGNMYEDFSTVDRLPY